MCEEVNGFGPGDNESNDKRELANAALASALARNMDKLTGLSDFMPEQLSWLFALAEAKATPEEAAKIKRHECRPRKADEYVFPVLVGLARERSYAAEAHDNE